MPLFNRYINLFKQPLFISCYIILLLLSYLFWDRTIAEYVYHLDLVKYLPYLQAITKMGLSQYYLLLLLCATVYFRFIDYKPNLVRDILFLLLTICIAGLLCDLLKFILGRARPELWFSRQIYGLQFFKIQTVYYSFPSGHTTVITALMLALSYKIPRYWLVFLAITLLVAASRVLLNAHYLSDVLGAFLITSCCVNMIYQYLYPVLAQAQFKGCKLL